ncbi:S1/P1 nuclease [Accumulibacter sp.]|uniref:S1/P1 nuclease n=1 Tax=Accumulibacter sp. TaxID=2053492 RepID=UPI002618C6DF|nr:S1/P1 nuclease [Accumulibacter sp.]
MLLALSVCPAMAWNAGGHRITAQIAWDSMDGETRSAVVELLRRHPDYERWQVRAKGGDPGLTAFLEASTWPDDIRVDSRFYTAGAEPPTVTQAGFPDMERRANWHYLDRPLTPEMKLPQPSGRLDRQLVSLGRTVGDPRAPLSERAYALPWLIHLVGDAHQPLHAASRYRADGQSDAGGSHLMIINPLAATNRQAMSLHRYWDDLPAPPWLRGSRLETEARALIGQYGVAPDSGEPEQWIDESWRIARQHAYPPEDASAVPTIGEDFHATARAIARRRVVEAGYRLADLLRRLLRHSGEPGAVLRR